jgi:DNA-3-methyladenine glycosylase II
MKKFFKFKLISEERIVELFNIEPELMNYLDAKKPFNIRVMPDHFQCFVHTVISQQLSSAAVDTIWNRMILNFKTITPKIIANASKETLSVIGLSPQKIGLIKQVSYDILDKKLNLKKLGKKNNNEISEILTKYKYLGQ